MRPGSRRRQSGQALVEWLIVAPLLLVLGLGLLQLAFVLQARVALAHALHEAARAASTGHGSETALATGLGRGLMSFWRESDPDATRARVLREQARGWIRWRRLGPDPRVFTDFGVPARDAFGRMLDGTTEIPNDNLRWRAARAGESSGLTLLEANRLSLELTYAVPLDVPFAGPFFGRALAAVLGCGGAGEWRVAATRVPALAASGDRSDCPLVRSADDGRWRWPVRLRTAIMMHSPLRRAAASPLSPPGATGSGAQTGPGSRSSDDRGMPVGVPDSGETSGQVRGGPSQWPGAGAGSGGQGAPAGGAGNGVGRSGGPPAGGWPVSAPASHAGLASGVSVLEQPGQCE